MFKFFGFSSDDKSSKVIDDCGKTPKSETPSIPVPKIDLPDVLKPVFDGIKESFGLRK